MTYAERAAIQLPLKTLVTGCSLTDNVICGDNQNDVDEDESFETTMMRRRSIMMIPFAFDTGSWAQLKPETLMRSNMKMSV